MQSLARMRAALERRNREMTGKVAELFRDAWALRPHGRMSWP